MSTPKRIQRKRTKGWRMPEGAVYVGRPSKWGNPTDTAEGYRRWLDGLTPCWIENGETLNQTEALRLWILEHIHELRGKDLMCWCKPGSDCHADVLLEMANETP